MKKIYQPTVQQMRLFEAVARHQSITRAAEECHLTQPSVSMQIKALEAKIGMPLLEQIGKSLFLTPAGKEVAEAAKAVLTRLAEMETVLLDMSREIAGPLSLSMISSARYFLPQILGNFKRNFPAVEPRVQIANRKTLLERISRNEDDIYIMGRLPDEGDLVAEPFLENIIVWVASPDHKLSGKKQIALTDIAKENILGREPGSGTRKAVEKIFEESGITLNADMEFDDAEAIKQGVISGLGIAYLSRHALRLELEAKELTVLDVANFPLKRRWYAIHHHGKKLSNAAQNFLEFIKIEHKPFVDE